MADIFRNGGFEADDWSFCGDDEPLPDGGPVVVSLARWLAERDVLGGLNRPVGVAVDGGDPVEQLGPDVGRLALIAVRFERFGDGRGYSATRLLRDRFGFRGELRAIGDVLADQIPLMWRCGFDSLAVSDPFTRGALAEGRVVQRALVMQPAAHDESIAVEASRPWLRRPQPSAPPH